MRRYKTLQKRLLVSGPSVGQRSCSSVWNLKGDETAMALRTKALIMAATAALLLASAAAGYDWKIWVSVDGNAPPMGYNPDYETTYIGEVGGQGAIWYINNVIKVFGVTPLEDTVEVWVDAGEYNDPNDWNGFWWSGFSRIHNLYLHGYSSDPSQTVINGNYRTQQGNAYEENTLILWDIHNGRVEDLTVKGGRINRIIDPAKKRAWWSAYNIAQIDAGGTTWSCYTREGDLIAGGIPLGTALTGAQAEDQQPAGVGLGTGGFLRVDEGAAGDKAYFAVTTWPNTNWSYDYGGHWQIEWKQDGTVEGDVKGEIQTGDFLKQPEEIYAGYAVVVRSSAGDMDWYEAYSTITFTNCVFSDSGQGLNVVDTCGPGTGPNGETAEIKCVDCTFRNLQSRAAAFAWSNGSFENCTFDTAGRNYTYSDYEDAVGNWDTGQGIYFEGTFNFPWWEYGPFTMSLTGCDFMHVREVDSHYSPDGCCFLYGDDWGWYPGNYGDISVQDCTYNDTGPALYLRDYSFDGARQGDVTVSGCESVGCVGPSCFQLELNGLPGTISDCHCYNANWDWAEYYAHSGFYLGGNQGAEYGVLGAQVTCTDCTVDNTPCGFNTNDTANVLLEDCADTNGGLSFWSAGFRSTGTEGASNTVIRRCESYGHSSLAFTNQGYQGNCGPLLVEDCVFADFGIAGLAFGNYTDQAMIRNCTIADSWPGYWADAVDAWWEPCYIQIDSCIIANIDEYAIGAWHEGSVFDISYSDVYNCLSGNYGPEDGGTVYEGPGMIYGDPLFVGSGDYHLTMNSPCIDAGNPSLAPSDFDWEGDSRVANDRVDMGADEYYTIPTAAPDPQPGYNGALFGQPQAGFPGWVWFSIPLTPDCPVGGGCADPNTLLGFNCGGSLFYWDRFGKFAQVYQPPFLKWDLSPGNGYLLRLTAPVTNPSYEGLSPFTPRAFEFKLGKMGWTWLGLPGLTPLTGDDFMNKVVVKYPSYDPGEYRTAAEDYAATPDNWVSWGWSFYSTYLQAPDTFTPYAPFGKRTCYPWLGYRAWVKVGTAATEDDFDQVTLIWPAE
jgi:hypothetical protein